MLEEGAGADCSQGGDFVLHADNLLADAVEPEMEGAAAGRWGEPWFPYCLRRLVFESFILRSFPHRNIYSLNLTESVQVISTS